MRRSSVGGGASGNVQSACDFNRTFSSGQATSKYIKRKVIILFIARASWNG